MKNSIYISLLAILFFSCKQNAFLTQRYTKYGHGHSVTKKSDKVVKENPKTELAIHNRNSEVVKDVKSEEGIVPEVQVDHELQANAENSYASVYSPKKVIKNTTSSGENSIYAFLKANAKSVIDQSQTKFENKKSDQSSFSYAKAIVGKVLRIIWFAIILCIIVGIIILVVMLG